MNRKLTQLVGTRRLSSLLSYPRTHQNPRMMPPRLQMQKYRQQNSQTTKPQTENSQAAERAEGQLPRPPPPQSMIPALLTVLLLLGIAATAVAIYDIYGMLTLWPPEVRTDLRAAIKAKSKGDLALSERFLRRAYETSKMLPRESFREEPYLKISGIAILLATVLEANEKHQQAYDVYLDALKLLQDAQKEERQLSGREKLRAVAISYKLAVIAATLSKPEDEEKHLVWAVEAILKNVLRLGEAAEHSERPPEVESALPPNSDTGVMITELSLPKWATKTDVAAPLEALGTFYAKAGRLDYAMPLYLQAISVLMPPSSEKATDEDRCRGAQLMCSLSDVILRSHHQPNEEILRQAEAWANKALEIAKQAKEGSATPDPTCEEVFAVALFNVAALRQLAGNKEEAKKLYQESLKQSEAIGLQPGVKHARDALRQLT